MTSSRRHVVLVTASGLHQSGRDLLEKNNCEVVFRPDVSDWTSPDAIDAVISRTSRLDADFFERNRHVRVVTKHGVGVDNIDVASATQRDIPIFVTPSANSRAVAEFAFTGILACLKLIRPIDASVRGGAWNRQLYGRQFLRATVGLVGFGSIAREVAALSSAVGMKVCFFDPFVTSNIPAHAEKAESLDALLCASDVISLHCPAQDDGTPLLTAEKFALIKAGAALVNTARGSLVDENALTKALTVGQLTAAVCDTFQHEPILPTSELLGLPNLLLSPHIAGSTAEALEQMAFQAAHNVIEFLKFNADGSHWQEDAFQSLIGNCVNPEVIDRLMRRPENAS